MALGIRRSVLQPLTGGINYTKNVTLVQPNQAQIIRNCHIDQDGQAFTRHGSRLLTTTTVTDAVTSIYDYRRPDGISHRSFLLMTAGKHLYQFNTHSGDFDSIANLSSATRPTWETFQDSSGHVIAFMANGTDFIKYDGDTVSNVADTYPWSSAPRYIMAYDDRMLAAGCDSDPYKIWVSGILDGTDWYPGDGDTAVNWTLKSSASSRVTALSTVYDFGVFFHEFGTEIITEADPDSTTSEHIVVSSEYGAVSHWGVQSIGNLLYFQDRKHFYRGELRAAIENGLTVTPIDQNIIDKYLECKNPTDVVSVYDAENQEIQWAIQTKTTGRPDVTLVYNVYLSSQPAYGGVSPYVWSGWFEGDGYEPYTLSRVIESDGDLRVYRGDKSGFVYVMEEETKYKDDTYESDATVENNIATEIWTGVLNPYGMAQSKRARTFNPYLYQRYDNSTTLRWVIDGAYTNTAVSINLSNLIPYWDSATWDGTIWNDEPVMVRPVNIENPFHYIQFIIRNAGTNARDSIAYSGGELEYQLHRRRREYG